MVVDVIVARTGYGKTQTLNEIAKYHYNNGLRVLHVYCEEKLKCMRERYKMIDQKIISFEGYLKLRRLKKWDKKIISLIKMENFDILIIDYLDCYTDDVNEFLNYLYKHINIKIYTALQGCSYKTYMVFPEFVRLTIIEERREYEYRTNSWKPLSAFSTIICY